MKRIAVITNDVYLFQKIKLDAPADTEVLHGKLSGADIILVDTDSGIAAPDGAVTMSRRGGADIKIPFALGTVAALTEKETFPLLTLNKGERCAYLRGERIRLTEVEFSLLSALTRRGGEYAERTDILREVWGDGTDAGIINVYVHYLREKLESHGEKIIISSRKCGYKIDKKYVGDSVCSE